MPVWALSPTPVEGFPNDYAPAMITVFYELLIKPDGNPGTAIAVLVMGALLLSLAVVVASLAQRLLARHGFNWEHILRILNRK